MNKSNSSIIVNDFSVDHCLENIDLWNDLASDSDLSFIFSDYRWLKAFWQTYDGIFDSKIYVASDLKTKKWLGILPVTRYKTGLIDLNTKIVAPTASEYSDYFSPIVRNEYLNQVFPILLKRFLDDRENVHLCKLSNVTDDRHLNSIIVDTLNKTGVHYKVSILGCPVLTLDGNEKSIIFNSFKKKHRDDIKRQINRLENLGTLSLKIFKNSFEIKENWYLFLRMYKDRWESSNQIDSMSKSKNKFFLKNLLENLDNSNIHFSGLFLNDKPISYHIGFYHNNRFYYYKPTYDIEYSKYSPGKIHIWFLIQKGCEDGWEFFDFLQGFENYKKNWVNYSNSTYTYTIHIKSWIRFYWQIKWKASFLKLIRKTSTKLIFNVRTFINKYTDTKLK